MDSKDVDIKCNTSPWKVCTNRHPETDGSPWGWIEGAPGEYCWSNSRSSRFTMDDACEAAASHNEWLREARHPEVKLVEAQIMLREIGLELENARQRFYKAQSQFDRMLSDVLKYQHELAELNSRG